MNQISQRTNILQEIKEQFSGSIGTVSETATKYRSEEGIVLFVEEIIGVKPKPYQARILRTFYRERRLAVQSLHGVGKTAVAAWIVIWLMSVYPPEVDVKVVTTASVWRQLEKFLWVEIKKWSLKANFELIGMTVRWGRELLGLSFKTQNKEAFAAASDKPETIEGAHATVLAYIFDEAKIIPDPTWDAAEGAFSQEGLDDKEVFALAISTPGDETGRFYEICSKKSAYRDWATDKITLEEALECGQVSVDWVENRKAQWGEESVLYRRKVKGEFASSASTSVIPHEWVELANERWLEWSEDGFTEDELSRFGQFIGCDPARFGDDKTGIAKFFNFVITSLETISKYDTMAVANYLSAMDEERKIVFSVDVIGLGAGVVDRLREKTHNVIAVNVSEATSMTDISSELGFADLRSALWWMMREYLDPERPREFLLALPPDDDLTTDLVAPSWSETRRGLIKVEGKKEIRKRLHRSTDKADATILALYGALVGSSHGIYV